MADRAHPQAGAQGEPVRAFDPHRPPDQALIDVCTHCGFCLPTCPTYLLWNEEMDSPRGRIVLMEHGLEPGSALDPMSIHFDRCLGCMACVTACPSGVQYDRLIEATRPQVERNVRRPVAERALRRLLFGLFTHPGRLRASVPLVAMARGLRGRSVRRRPPSGRLASLVAMATLAPRVPLRNAVHRTPGFTRGRGARRGRVGVVLGCVQRIFFPAVNDATVRVLSAEGFDVFAPPLPRCCGALALHTGYEPEAVRLAKRTIEAFEGCDTVVTNAAGCGSAMKDYGELLSEDPVWAERAARFAERVRDITELLAEVPAKAERHPVRLRVAYHDACHLAHAQGIRAQPRAVLGSIPGLEVLEPPEWEICCGSAGLYNVLQPAAAHDLGRRKAESLLTTGAEAVVAGNPGCALQIATHLVALGHPLPIHHPIEVLDASIGGTTPATPARR